MGNFRSGYRARWRVFAPLAQNGSFGVPAEPVQYVFRDEFTDNLSAGSIDGTAAVPGPLLTRTVSDTNSLLSLSGGQLIKSSGSGGSAHDPILQYQAGVTREVGKLLCMRVAGAASLQDTFVGYTATLDTRPSANAINFQTASTNLRLYYNASLVVVNSYTDTGDYKVAIALRASGAFFFITGTEYTGWTLLGWNTSGTQGTLYPGYGGQNATYQSDYIRVPQELWLPSPILSDGFSSSQSDGQAHAETSGIGSGGSALSWVDAVGTWGVSGGTRSSSALSGGLAINTTDVSVSDFIYEAALTRSGDNVGVVARYIDSNNYVYAYHDGTSVTLRQVAAGVDSELIAATAATYAAGRVLRLSISGNTARMFYNLAAIGGAVSIDASLASATKVGLYTTNTGNTFDNALCYAAGSGNEYSTLNRFFNSSSSAVFTVGDSKTAAGVYQNYLIKNLLDSTNSKWVETSPRFSASGYKAADIAAYVSSNLSSVIGPDPIFILVNIGINDIVQSISEATFTSSYASFLDDFHAKWPQAVIYCSIPWGVGYDSESDALAGFISSVIGTRNFAVIGPDERVYLKSDDNGTTYMSGDGIHPNTNGYILMAQQWNAILTS